SASYRNLRMATEAAPDLDRASINLDSVQSLEAGARESRAAYENLRKDESRWGEIANEADLVKQLALDVNGLRALLATNTQTAGDINQKRSEERRVGKEC